MRRILTLTLALTLALLAPALAAAQADDDNLARAHFESGSAYYEQGRYEDAAREFFESYRLSPRPVLLENAARAQERALEFDDAIATLQRLLREHPDYPQAATIRERITSYERLRDRLQSGDDNGSERVHADPVDEQHAEASTTNDGAPATGGGGSVSVPGIILLAAGGALGIATIITGVVSQSIFDDLASACGAGVVCPPERQGDVDTGESMALVSTILLFPSVIAIGVGIVLLIVDTGGGGEEQAALEVVPGPGEAGVALRGRF